MTFPTQETSTEQGAPVSLFHFVYGQRPQDYFAYTDFDVPITHNTIVYEPTVIEREEIQVTGQVEDQRFEIQINPNSVLMTYLQTRTPTQSIYLTIRQGHYEDPDNEFLVVWMGSIRSHNRKDRVVELACDSVLASMRRLGLKRNYQRGCPWPLYGTHCAAARVVRSRQQPLSLGRNVFTVPSVWNGALEKSKFISGYVSWEDVDYASTQVRTITDVTTEQGGYDVIQIQGITDGLALTSEVEFFLGCNHQVSDCENLHNNLLNYGGQHKVPTQNPVGYVNRFY